MDSDKSCVMCEDYSFNLSVGGKIGLEKTGACLKPITE